MSPTRDISLDIMKAIGILSIIVGHYGLLRGVVYSFHVPLFFIIGGYVFRQKNVREELLTDTKRLIIPYLITAFVIALWKSIFDWRGGYLSGIANNWKAALLGCGLPQEMWLFGHCEQIGAIWFLLALFVCRIVYDVLDKYLSSWMLSIICMAVSIGSVIFYNNVTPFPFDILQGLSMLIFYDFGRNLKNYGGWSQLPLWGLIIGLFVWGAAIYWSYMEVVICSYRYFMLDILGAISATCIIGYVSQHIARLPKIGINWLIWIGQSSLGLLCLHLIDLETNILHKIQHFVIGTHYHNSVVHCLIVVVISCVVIYLYDCCKKKLNVKYE